MPSTSDVLSVSPAFQHYADATLIADVWQRPHLSPRDRCIVTIAALIARNPTVVMADSVRLALDQEVRPDELSEIILHPAFYAGWPHAKAAVDAVKQVFAERRIRPEQLHAVSPTLLPIDAAAEQKRAERVEQDVGSLPQRWSSTRAACC